MNQALDGRVKPQVAHEWHNRLLWFCRTHAEAWLGNIDSRCERFWAAATMLDA
jgi:hypothetical protein